MNLGEIKDLLITDLRSCRIRERNSLDKAIFAITAGTLSLSITFISSSSHTFQRLDVLVWSWGVLILGLVATLLAYQFSIAYFGWYEEGLIRDQFNASDEPESSWRRTVAEVLNYVSLAATIIGMILFAVFGYLNV